MCCHSTAGTVCRAVTATLYLSGCGPRVQIRYAAADAACLLAILDSLVAVASPRQHVLDGTITPQRTVSATGQPAPEAVLADDPAAVEAPGTQHPSERSSAVPGEDDMVQRPGSDEAEPSSRMAAAEVVRWWSEQIQLSGRGTLVRNYHSLHRHGDWRVASLACIS